MNPDVELLDSSLSSLAEEVGRPGAPPRLLAPLVLLPDGSRQDSAQIEPCSSPLLLAAIVPPAALPRRLRVAVEPWRSDRPRRVGWAVGCCVVSQAETLRSLGPFDERIFMFGDDLELCLRAGEQGIETWFRPEARVLHHSSYSHEEAFGGEPYEPYARQRRAVIAERLGGRRALLDDWVQMVTYADRIVLKALLGRSSERERRRLAALRAVRRESPTLETSNPPSA